MFDHIEAHLADDTPPAVYVGSTMLDRWFPGFTAENDIGIAPLGPLASVWIGNRTRVSAHYDFPSNIACNVMGRRRFTVFPPEALPDLHFGPLDVTPSGQSISLVDFAAPDLVRHPRFPQALAVAEVAELEPGDAIYLPSMWIHHVGRRIEDVVIEKRPPDTSLLWRQVADTEERMLQRVRRRTHPCG